MSRGGASAPESEERAVLLIDGNLHGAPGRRVVLEEMGFPVTTVATLTQGCEALARRPYAVVIVDDETPSGNSKGCVAALKECQPTQPVIVVSALADALALDRGNTGAEAVIQKGAHEVTLLVQAVRRLARKRPVRRPPASVDTTRPAIKHRGR